MWIESLKVRGFRSYRDPTIVTFDPYLNAIIGSNGSGKSNLAMALIYVLQPQRRNSLKPFLLHCEESDGMTYLSPEIELVINNEDRRFLTLPEKVVVLCVVGMGSKSDSIYVNRKPHSVVEWIDLLKGAGLVRDNYFAVRQGEIVHLAMASPPQRFKMLCDFAGVGEYEKKRLRSNRLLDDSQKDIQRAHSEIARIETKIEAVAAEKEELDVKLKLQKKKSGILYVLTAREYEALTTKLSKLHKEKKSFEHECYAEMLKMVNERDSQAEQIQKLELEVSAKVLETKLLREDYELRLTDLHKIEETTASAFEEIDKTNSSIEKLQSALNEVEKSKVALEELLGEKEADLALKQGRYDELAENIHAREQKIQLFYDRRGRCTMNDKDRQNMLIGSLAQIDQDIVTNEALIDDLQNGIDTLEEEKANLAIVLARKLSEAEDLKNQKTATEIRWQTDAKERNTLDTERKILQTHILKAENLDALKGEQEALGNLRSKHHIRTRVDGDLSVRKILKHLQENSLDPWVQEGYLGTVANNISCQEVLHLAISVSAGKRLLYHIVKTKEVANRILCWAKKLNLPGDMDFLPLDNLVTFPSIPEHVLRSSSDLAPILSKISFPKEAELAFKFIFNNTVILRNEAASNSIRGLNINGIMLDGTQLTSKGVLTGGFYSKKAITLSLYKEWESQAKLRKEMSLLVDKQKSDLNQLQSSLNVALERLSKSEVKLDSLKRNLMEATAEVALDQRKISDIDRLLCDRKSALMKKKHFLNDLKLKRRTTKAEIDGESDASSQEERAEVETVIKELEVLRRNLRKMGKKMQRAKQSRDATKNELQLIVATKLADFNEKKDSLAAELQKLRSNCTTTDDQRNLLRSTVQEYEQNLDCNQEIIEKLSNELFQATQKMQKINSKLTTLEATHQSKLLEASKSSLQEQRLTKELNDCLQRLENFTAPESIEKYESVSSKKLKNYLPKLNRELEKYGDVDIRAQLEHDTLISQKKAFTLMLKDSEESLEKSGIIIERLESIESDKVNFTFKQVKKYFEEIFQILVPYGKGQLAFERSKNSGSEDGDNLELLVKVFVSFSGGQPVCELSHLSGGQKTVVALAYMFALQKCDPSPLYIFDEIDACLDADSRSRVANWLSDRRDNREENPASSQDSSNVEIDPTPRPCKSPQFISITFRKELVEHANKVIGVSIANNASRIHELTKESALEFIAHYCD